MDELIGGGHRPPIHLLDSESDLVGSLALQAEHNPPVVAAMLLAEIERAELHDAKSLPDNVVTLGSEVDFIDEKTGGQYADKVDQGIQVYYFGKEGHVAHDDRAREVPAYADGAPEYKKLAEAVDAHGRSLVRAAADAKKDVTKRDG